MQISYHQQSIQTWTALLAPIKTATLATTTTSSSSSSHYAAHPSHSLSEVANGKPHTNLLQSSSVPNRPASGTLNLKNGFGTPSVNGHHNSDHHSNSNAPNTQVQQQSTQTMNNQLVNRAGEYNKQLNPNTTTNNNNSNTTIDLLSADFPFYDGAESSFFQSPATTRAEAPPTSTDHNYDPYAEDNGNNTLIMTSNDSYADITSYINDISTNTTTTNNTNTNNHKGANKKDKGRNKKSGSVSDFTDA